METGGTRIEKSRLPMKRLTNRIIAKIEHEEERGETGEIGKTTEQPTLIGRWSYRCKHKTADSDI